MQQIGPWQPPSVDAAEVVSEEERVMVRTPHGSRANSQWCESKTTDGLYQRLTRESTDMLRIIELRPSVTLRSEHAIDVVACQEAQGLAMGHLNHQDGLGATLCPHSA